MTNEIEMVPTKHFGGWRFPYWAYTVKESNEENFWIFCYTNTAFKIQIYKCSIFWTDSAPTQMQFLWQQKVFRHHHNVRKPESYLSVESECDMKRTKLCITRKIILHCTIGITCHWYDTSLYYGTLYIQNQTIPSYVHCSTIPWSTRSCVSRTRSYCTAPYHTIPWHITQN